MGGRQPVDSSENNGLWDWNLETNRVFFSPRWLSMLGCEQQEVGNSPEEWLQRIHPEDRKQVQAWVEAHLAGGPAELESHHRMRHKDGSYRWMSCRGLTLWDEKGRAVRLSGSHVDITAEKVSDPLTGLPNRFLLLDRLSNSIQRAKRHGEFYFALLLLNVDRFKTVIERLGARGADQLLIATARRLETCLRAGDTVARLGGDHMLARVGGDEFTILLDGLNQVGDAKTVAERLLQEIAAPFHIAGREVFLTASVGIALSATGYSDPEEILRDADTAMYRAKSLGKARCEVFDTAILKEVENHRQLEIDLRQAVARNEFVLAYQPIISLATKRIAGFEALVRWNHPARGLVSPLDFIPAAEQTGVIVPLGRWVLAEACRQTREWQEKFPELWISVNLSGVQFLQPSFARDIEDTLKAAGLPPRSLILELTESSIMQNPEAVSSMLMRLRVLGVQIAIDDFGTGYSSLSYLRQFPLDYLKVDHTFLRSAETSRDTAEVVRTVANLSHQLGLRVIAEGIENAGQLSFIESLNCEYGQGFLFAKPVASDRAATLLEAGLTALSEDSGKTEGPAAAPASDERPPKPGRSWKKFRGIASACLALTAFLLISGYLSTRSRPAPPAPAAAPSRPPTAAPSRQPAAAPSRPPAAAPSRPPAAAALAPTALAAKVDAAPAARNAAPAARLEKPIAETPSPTPTLTFPVIHNHVFGSCRGTLQVAADAVSFFSEKEKDSFRLEQGSYSVLIAEDQLTLKSQSKTYNFKSAIARGKSENSAELAHIARSISAVHSQAGSGGPVRPRDPAQPAESAVGPPP